MIDYFRKNKKKTSKEVTSGYFMDNDNTDDEFFMMNEIGVEDENLNNLLNDNDEDRKIRLGMAICKLSPDFADVMNDKLSGKSEKEIANKYNLPIGTVKSRLHSAKQKIKKFMLLAA